jgi:hypothetical protein
MRANYRTSLEDVSGRDETPALLWLANVGVEPLTQSQIGLVRQALDGGAYLLAEVAGGDPDRGETFRAELHKIDPRLSVRKLHTSHPIFTGGIEGTQGYDVRRSRLSKTLREEVADEGRCDLYALELEGREVGVLSQYDLSAGVTFMRYPGRRGPGPRAAREMGVNVVLHAMELRVK